MRNANRALLAICGFALALLPPAEGTDKPRLVPTKVVASLQVSFKQDGKALDVKVSNPSDDWVVLQADIQVQYVKKAAGPCVEVAGNPSAPQGSIFSAGYSICPAEPSSGSSKEFSFLVQPRSFGSVYLEVDADRTVEKVLLGEVRGREATFVERTRAKLR